MTKRFDVLSPRPGKDDKTFWHRVGTAWEGDKGISITFDSLPLPGSDGKVRVTAPETILGSDAGAKALVKDDALYLQAGAGIVADSDPEAEYQETMSKARAMIQAIDLAREGED